MRIDLSSQLLFFCLMKQIQFPKYSEKEENSREIYVNICIFFMKGIDNCKNMIGLYKMGFVYEEEIRCEWDWNKRGFISKKVC